MTKSTERPGRGPWGRMRAEASEYCVLVCKMGTTTASKALGGSENSRSKVTRGSRHSAWPREALTPLPG